MIKGINMKFMMVALMSIIVISSVTLNVSAVNSNVTDKASSSNSKWIKIPDSRYGNISVREDALVRQGNITRILPVTDGIAGGIVTPRLEKITPPKYVDVDTPYGTVSAPSETYQMLGKEQLATNFKSFIDMRNELIKEGKINPNENKTFVAYSNSSVIDGSLIRAEPASADSSALALTPLTVYDKREDTRYNAKSGYYPRYIYGRVDPVAGNPRRNAGTTNYSFQEMEVHFNHNDTVEIVLDHGPNSEIVWIALFDDDFPEYFVNSNASYHLPSVVADGPIEYYVLYNTGGYYDMYLYNPRTNHGYDYIWKDWGVSSTYISFLDASTELEYTSLSPSWYDESTIEQWTSMCGSTYYYPGQVFDYDWLRSNYHRDQYVDSHQSFNDGNIIYTFHADGNGVT